MMSFDGNTRRRLEQKTKVFKALGHLTRLFIVEQSAQGSLKNNFPVYASLLHDICDRLHISPDGSVFACVDEAPDAQAAHSEAAVHRRPVFFWCVTMAN